MNPFASILEGYLEDFEGGISNLMHFHADGDVKNLQETARLLCGISRDVMFTIGLLSDHQDEYVQRIIRLFGRAVELIAPDRELMSTYRRCIEGRAKDLADELSSVPR